MLLRNNQITPNVCYEFEREPTRQEVGSHVLIDPEPGTTTTTTHPNGTTTTTSTVAVDEKKVDESGWITYFEDNLDAATWDALAPLHAVIGAIDASMGGNDVRRHYRWPKDGRPNTTDARASIVVRGNKTLDELWRNNRHLGPKLLATAVAAYTRPETVKILPKDKRGQYSSSESSGSESLKKPRYDPDAPTEDDVPYEDVPDKMTAKMQIGNSFSFIGPRIVQIPQHSADELAHLRQLQGRDNVLMLPDWVWCTFKLPVFQFLLSHTTFGGLQMAASELGRIPKFRDTPKDEFLCDLLVSEDVRDIFCEYVAQKFTKASGGNAYPGTISGTGHTRYNISAGYKTRTLNATWRMGAKLFFEEHVMYVTVPRPAIDLDAMYDGITATALELATTLQRLLDAILLIKARFNTDSPIPTLEQFRQLEIEYLTEDTAREKIARLISIPRIQLARTVTDQWLTDYRTLVFGLHQQERKRAIAIHQHDCHRNKVLRVFGP